MSPDTLLAKESRVWFIMCERCGSKGSVSAIETGFQAQTSVCLPVPTRAQTILLMRFRDGEPLLDWDEIICVCGRDSRIRLCLSKSCALRVLQ